MNHCKTHGPLPFTGTCPFCEAPLLAVSVKYRLGLALARVERLEKALRACRAALMRLDIAKPDAVGDAQQAWADAIALADAALEEKS